MAGRHVQTRATHHRTLNWSAYDAALHERGSPTVWIDPSTPWHAASSGRRGAQPVYGDAAIQACLAVKVLADARSGGRPGSWRTFRSSPASIGRCRTSRRPADARRRWPRSCPAEARAARCTGSSPLWTSLRDALSGRGRHRHRGSGRRVRGDHGPGGAAKAHSTAGPGDACGARCISPSMRRHSKSGPSRQPAAASTMHPTTPDLLSRIPEDEPIASATAPSRDIAPQCPAGQWTAPMTVAPAGTPSRTEARTSSSRPGAAGRNGALRAVK